MKLQLFAALMLAAPLGIVSAHAAANPSPNNPMPNNPTPADRVAVARQIQEWQPSADERKFDEIAWIPDLIDAEQLAKENQRPVFLFTYDGHMAIGRC